MPCRPAASERAHVLIVEDELATYFALRSQFLERGYKVSRARTSEEARSLLAEAPRYVVVDLGLADGEAEEVLRLVRSSGIPSLVAIVLDGPDPSRVEELRRWNPEHVLTKPVDFQRLLRLCDGNATDRDAEPAPNSRLN
jgi:DNA-binding response OmpR family regulator